MLQVLTHPIRLEFGMNKCALVHLKKVRCENFAKNAQLVDGSNLHRLNTLETYTHLGMEQHDIHEVNTVKKRFTFQL